MRHFPIRRDGARFQSDEGQPICVACRHQFCQEFLTNGCCQMDQTSNNQTIATEKAPSSVVAQIMDPICTASLADLLTEIAAIEREKQSLNRQRHTLARMMLSQIRGIPVESLSELLPQSALDREVQLAMAAHQAAYEERLMAASDLGRRILELRQLKASLLGIDLLAGSPDQLLARAAKLLGDEQESFVEWNGPLLV